MSPVSRRDFLVATTAAGAGLVIGLYMPSRQGGSKPFAPNAWLKITPDNRVTIVAARPEMGQGVRTSLAMVVAEELEVDWSKVTIEAAPLNRALYGDQSVGGSASVKESYEPLRKAGAAARDMLLTAAAARWGVLKSSCKAEQGSVVHAASNRRLTYGELADDAGRLPVPGDARLKDPKDFKLIGKAVKRVDTPSKTDGSAQFGIDFKLPGMKYAVVARPVTIGATVKDFNPSESKAIKGVRDVVKVQDNAVAVIADSVWAAMEGRRVLNVNWNAGPYAGLNSADIRKSVVDRAAQPGVVWRTEGDAERALRGGRTVTAQYEVPFLDHAPMEPMNCTANFANGRCELWVPTQVPGSVQAEVSSALGVERDAVSVNITLLGGGFGRRLEEDYAIEAALISKAAGGPVKVLWTREDDMRHGFYRPTSYHVLRAAVDGQGFPIAWSHKITAPSILSRWEKEILKSGDDPVVASQSPNLYNIPNMKLEYALAQTPVPVGWWRSVYASQVAFAHEGFFDEVATLGGKDPYELRKRLLTPDREVKSGGDSYNTARLRGVLDLAAEKAGWGKPLPAGRFRGIACYPSFDTYAAEVAEVSIEDGNVRVHRVVAAIDCGRAVNPGIIRQQVEGAVVFGLSAGLKGAITIEKGAVKQGNFDEYELVRMHEAPEVEVHIVESSAKPTGVGEPGVPPIAPAVANAVFAATGKRVRQLPMRL
jgi:isoquinoline 1-oxidoreductase beta subunit